MIHFQDSASSVRCGAKMRYVDTAADDPDGWDLGNCTVSSTRVTCPACRCKLNTLGLSLDDVERRRRILRP